MKYNQFESMLNPIRMKIIKEIASRDTATTKEIADICGDIPLTTLYRHINRLVKDGILEIASENKVRGILEKVYTLRMNPIEELNKESEQYSKEQLSDMFYQFTMSLLLDFQKYLSRDNFNMAQDGAGFQSYPLYLSDEEFMEMMGEIYGSLKKRMDNKPTKDRTLRKLSTIITPEKESEDVNIE